MERNFGYVLCAMSTNSSVEQRAQTVLWFSKFEPIIGFHLEFRREFGERRFDVGSIRRWYDQLAEIGSVAKRHPTLQSTKSDEDIDRVSWAHIT
jgi:hypothetical protein